jgi:hypothetical protein
VSKFDVCSSHGLKSDNEKYFKEKKKKIIT